MRSEGLKAVMVSWSPKMILVGSVILTCKEIGVWFVSWVVVGLVSLVEMKAMALWRVHMKNIMRSKKNCHA